MTNNMNRTFKTLVALLLTALCFVQCSQTDNKLGKAAAPILKSAERIFQRQAFIDALTPAEKAMRR